MIIGLIGPTGSGKTTVANYLTSRGFVRTRVTLALKGAFLPLIELALLYEGVLDDEADTLDSILDYRDGDLKTLPLKFFGGKSSQEAQQDMGMFMRQAYGDDFFPRYWKMWMQQISNPRYVLEDIRFPEEAQMVLDVGGILIKIIGRERITSAAALQHETETALDNSKLPYYPLYNTGTLEELYESVEKIVIQADPEAAFHHSWLHAALVPDTKE